MNRFTKPITIALAATLLVSCSPKVKWKLKSYETGEVSTIYYYYGLRKASRREKSLQLAREHCMPGAMILVSEGELSRKWYQISYKCMNKEGTNSK